MESPVSSGVKATNPSSMARIDESLSPASLDSVVIAERDTTATATATAATNNSVECLEMEAGDQLMHHLSNSISSGDHGTTTALAYVPLYAALAVSQIFSLLFALPFCFRCLLSDSKRNPCSLYFHILVKFGFLSDTILGACFADWVHQQLLSVG